MEYIRNLPRSPRQTVDPTKMGILLLLAAGAVACDRSDEGSVRKQQCERFCEQLEKCDDRTDVLDCQKHCAADEVRSDDYFKARASCAEDDACNQWSSEVDSQGDDTCTGSDCHLRACIDRKLADVELTDEQERACSSMATGLVNCDAKLDRNAINAECQRITPALSADYVDESQRCVESLCGDIQACLDKLANREGTELRVFSGMVSR